MSLAEVDTSRSSSGHENGYPFEYEARGESEYLNRDSSKNISLAKVTNLAPNNTLPLPTVSGDGHITSEIFW